MEVQNFLKDLQGISTSVVKNLKHARNLKHSIFLCVYTQSLKKKAASGDLLSSTFA